MAMSEKQRISIMMKHYFKPKIKFLMLPYLQNRELALLSKIYPKSNTRNIRCHNVQMLDKIFKRLNLFKKGYSLYYSVARFNKGVPFYTLILTYRDTHKWNKTANENIESYDYVIDIDSPDDSSFIYARDSAYELAKFFLYSGLPFRVRYSGRGFHFVIDSEHVPPLSFDPSSDFNIYRALSNVSKYLYSEICEFIDTGIYDSRRVIKVPYSLAVYEDDIRVCVPISDIDFLRVCTLADFSPDLFDINFGQFQDKQFNESCDGKLFFKEINKKINLKYGVVSWRERD